MVFYKNALSKCGSTRAFLGGYSTIHFAIFISAVYGYAIDIGKQADENGAFGSVKALNRVINMATFSFG
jgi:hypothetical protein